MKIEKGTKNGLPYFIELDSYFHSVKNKWIQINYNEFCETPDDTKCFEGACPPILIQDILPLTKYTDYCNQFGAAAIEEAINNHLSSL